MSNSVIILKTNSLNILGRIVSLMITILIEYLFISYLFKENNIDKIIFWKIKSVHLLYFLIAIIAFFALTIILSLLGISKVLIDKNSHTITLASLFYKKIISVNDIKEYSTTTHRNQFKKFAGLLLKLYNDKVIQLAGQNIISIYDLKIYLADKQISYLGERKMKFPFN